MLLKSPPLQNIFSDRSSLVLRTLLKSPERAWTLHDLIAESQGVSFGQTWAVLDRLEEVGLLERRRGGRESWSKLTDAKKLLEMWTQNYRFDQNPRATFYSEKGGAFLPALKSFLEKRNVAYALTLYSASRRIAPYVLQEGEYIYLDVPPKTANGLLQDMQAQLGLKPLKSGANVCFAVPYYKSSVFSDISRHGGHPVVSMLQLYLDLMGFPPTGPEQAQWLFDHLKEKGDPLV